MATEKDIELRSGSKPSLGKKEKIVTEPGKKYLHHPRQKKQSEKNYALAEQFAPNRDLPTTADGLKGLLDLPSIMSAVDPQGLSAISPMMFQMIGKMSASMSGSSESNRKETLQNAFGGALALLSNKYTYPYLKSVFDKALENNGINLIDARLRSVVTDALDNLYKNYEEYGEGNIPVATVDVVKTIDAVPTPVVVNVPDLYIQQYYYSQDLDPYPGYIKWVSQDGLDVVYTERKIGDPYFTTADQEVYTLAEQELAIALEPYVIENNLTANILNRLLLESDSNIQKNSAEKTGGKNSSNNLMDILMKLAGYAGQITNLQQAIQLPVSVLNKSSIKNSQEKFLKNQGQLQQLKNWARDGLKK